MGGREDSVTKEETYEWRGERDALVEQYFPSNIQVTMEDDMPMLATEEEEINQKLGSIPLEEMQEDDPVFSK